MIDTHSLADNPQMRQLLENLPHHPSRCEEKYTRLTRLLQATYDLTIEESQHWINHWIETHTHQ